MAASGGSAAPVGAPSPGSVDVIVELAPPPAALAATPEGERRSLRRAAQAQTVFLRRLASAVPEAEPRWRYRLVLDGVALTLPAGDVAAVAALPGVVRVYPSVRYRGLASPQGARPARVPAGLTVVGDGGRGVKIGIIDDGIDQGHPYFDPAGYVMPAGFPKGDRPFTTAKVIVARAFAPDNTGYRYAARPFDPVRSFHGTHVAGIAAGNAGTPVREIPGVLASGTAPLAYLGNYKALTVPTAGGVGLNGSSPELVAAIEAAVADGMDVINLSLGEPQVEPEHDAVARALDAAAAAGVVPVVAAGNEYEVLGRGSVGSPGTAEQAVTVGALDPGFDPTTPVMAAFSASGPTPLGLAAKPDVSAPGVDVLSASPGDGFVTLSGTSMATPYVAGVAAGLRGIYREWTVGQLKSALVLTAGPVYRDRERTGEAPSARQGGGAVDATAAAEPGVFASSQSFSFGLLDVSGGSASVTESVALSPDGEGGDWQVQIVEQQTAEGVTVVGPASAAAPGTLALTATATGAAAEGEHTGFAVLTRGDLVRRIPFWFRVTRPRLPGLAATELPGAGTYRGNTRGRPAGIGAYRYPDAPPSTAGPMRGPEQVFRIVLDRPAANLGAAVASSARGVEVEPRIVAGDDENRLRGATTLPYVANPYLARFGFPVWSSAALFPSAGVYSVVFDSELARQAGRFTFRVWVGDVTPPTVRFPTRVARDGRIRVRVSDQGSGVDPDGIVFRVAGLQRSGSLRGGVVTLDLRGIRPGTHRLRLQVSDRQEAKNTENVAGLLPNTRVVQTTVRITGR